MPPAPPPSFIEVLGKKAKKKKKGKKDKEKKEEEAPPLAFLDTQPVLIFPKENVSRRFLREHRQKMNKWLDSEWEDLVRRQECAVEAVKLEWLVNGGKELKRQRRNMRKRGDAVVLTKAEERRLSGLLERELTIT